MEKIINLISKGLHYISYALVIFMMLIITVDVFGRFVLNQSLRGSVELTGLSLALLVFFSLSYTHQVKEHISIDFLVEKFPKKVQKIFDIVINIIITILMSLVTWQLLGYSTRLFNSNTSTNDLGLPIYLFIIAAAIGTAAFSLVALLRVFQILSKRGEIHES